LTAHLEANSFGFFALIFAKRGSIPTNFVTAADHRNRAANTFQTELVEGRVVAKQSISPNDGWLQPTIKKWGSTKVDKTESLCDEKGHKKNFSGCLERRNYHESC